MADPSRFALDETDLEKLTAEVQALSKMLVEPDTGPRPHCATSVAPRGESSDAAVIIRCPRCLASGEFDEPHFQRVHVRQTTVAGIVISLRTASAVNGACSPGARNSRAWGDNGRTKLQ
jgi:hypothetical protein